MRGQEEGTGGGDRRRGQEEGTGGGDRRRGQEELVCVQLHGHEAPPGAELTVLRAEPPGQGRVVGHGAEDGHASRHRLQPAQTHGPPPRVLVPVSVRVRRPLDEDAQRLHGIEGQLLPLRADGEAGFTQPQHRLQQGILGAQSHACSRGFHHLEDMKTSTRSLRAARPASSTLKPATPASSSLPAPAAPPAGGEPAAEFEPETERSESRAPQRRDRWSSNSGRKRTAPGHDLHTRGGGM
ncbi:hypothetical protein EYF80_044678 [Liparis tanakae]|uniref:Uncharacterized protein n=1 Tax=Liparis tanakae TaxID=230148 RepID=A0A4Z2FVC7_9TELE|nr:hypothetical protein EYF80_044678 [Liparis tanakae]